jgi:hypothetical protein
MQKQELSLNDTPDKSGENEAEWKALTEETILHPS